MAMENQVERNTEHETEATILGSGFGDINAHPTNKKGVQWFQTLQPPKLKLYAINPNACDVGTPRVLDTLTLRTQTC